MRILPKLVAQQVKYPRWMNDYDGINGMEKLIYIFLTGNSSGKTQVFIKHDTIAKFAVCHVSSVKRYISSLVEKGFISVLKKQYVNVYYFLRHSIIEEFFNENYPEYFNHPIYVENYVESDGYSDSQTLAISKVPDSQKITPDSQTLAVSIYNNINNNKYPPNPQKEEIKNQGGEFNIYDKGNFKNQYSKQQETLFNSDFAENTEFEKFWELYPRKQGHDEALKIWNKYNLSPETIEHIFKAVKHQKAHNESWQRENGRYIPFPINWLLKRLWLDFVEKSVVKTPVFDELSEEQKEKNRLEVLALINSSRMKNNMPLLVESCSDEKDKSFPLPLPVPNYFKPQCEAVYA